MSSQIENQNRVFVGSTPVTLEATHWLTERDNRGADVWDSRQRLEAMFEAHQREVFAYALRRLSGVADAEDATAETFVVAFRRIAEAPEPGESLAWLYAIARRVVANHRRSLIRRLVLAARLERAARTSTGPRLVAPATEALARLRPQDQELLRLVAWERLSEAEAAMVLGTTASAVAIRLTRVRRRFAEEMARIRQER